MIRWVVKPFEGLTGKELYDVLQLRQDVFVVEQTCLYRDIDGLDVSAYHLMGVRDGALVAYARILPPGTPYPACAFGRVAVGPSERGRGLGRELVGEVMSYIEEVLQLSAVEISAQAHLETFYSAYGFVAIGAPYLEDGILHIHMKKG